MNARSALCLAVLAGLLQAADWPQFLGPARNGVYVGTNLADSWPKEGPPVVWRDSGSVY